MKKIESKNNDYIKKLAKLGLKKEIIDKELFLVEGSNLINESRNSEIIFKLLITNEDMYPDISDDLKIKVSDEIIRKLSQMDLLRNIAQRMPFSIKRILLGYPSYSLNMSMDKVYNSDIDKADLLVIVGEKT